MRVFVVLVHTSLCLVVRICVYELTWLARTCLSIQVVKELSGCWLACTCLCLIGTSGHM